MIPKLLVVSIGASLITSKINETMVLSLYSGNNSTKKSIILEKLKHKSYDIIFL
ncbi:hypothetical protein JoomaDRAFT_2610 [Galbibacter orientalis DSM 19592]|uniref:Uncharacterized protein n=1 Tax=Galbibacter orientalis DSM 19592 TaxID=926559 RepID=I3C7I9_9FLAO|nr:hypothetical protein JoomaDRAFT_2610 [Galbibacter orientalis DSM 19592]